jgi:hypothetical protein
MIATAMHPDVFISLSRLGGRGEKKGRERLA